MSVRQGATAAGAIAAGQTWEEALDGALAQTGEAVQGADLVLVFASHAYAAHYHEILARLRELTASRGIAGCSGQAIIGTGREIEDRPALSVLGITMPGATIRLRHITQSDVAACTDADGWHSLTGVSPESVNAWLILADPFSLDAERLLDGLSRAYPGVPLIGGMASGDFRARSTYVFAGTRVHGDGAVLIALGGAYTVRTVVAQGAAPIGETWTVTGVEANWITGIGGRSPMEVLTETFQALSAEMQVRAQTNLLIGVAMNEYQADFGRGDFLIRNVLGGNRETGAIAIGDQPRVGQTVQFQVRDARAADDDLRELLSAAHADMGGATPLAAVLCSCNGRGVGLFGAPNHDVAAVAEHLGPVPVAGFFCNGEIGPVGGRPFLHGFTASIALIVPVA
jgi:small ligand-binding sensory domain FIST